MNNLNLRDELDNLFGRFIGWCDLILGIMLGRLDYINAIAGGREPDKNDIRFIEELRSDLSLIRSFLSGYVEFPAKFVFGKMILVRIQFKALKELEISLFPIVSVKRNIESFPVSLVKIRECEVSKLSVDKLFDEILLTMVYDYIDYIFLSVEKMLRDTLRYAEKYKVDIPEILLTHFEDATIVYNKIKQIISKK